MQPKRCRKETAPSLDCAAGGAFASHDAPAAHAKDWGDRWIVIPNPLYGEWMKPLDRGPRDVDQLVPE